jgi:hypothetical protein
MRRRCFLAALALAGLVIAAVASSATSVAAPTEGRAWELVTPKEPTAAIVRGLSSVSPTGDRAVYSSVGPIPGSPSGDLISVNVATRGPSGWTSTALGFPYSSFAEEVTLLPSAPAVLSQDLSTAVWLSSVPLVPGGPPEGNFGIYRPTGSGTPALIADIGDQQPRFIRASDDVTHVVFPASTHLLPADAGRTSGASIYESSGPVLSMVDVDSTGNALSSCGSEISGANAVSSSGERIFFRNPAAGEPCSELSHVYLREGGTTIDVGDSECTRADCGPEESIGFAGATPSGSAAFLVTSQQLTNADADSMPDLYRYDAEAAQLELLSGGPDLGGSVVGEALVPSVDGSRVYFYATGRLIPGLGSESEANLYMADGSGLHFLASLPSTTSIEVDRDGESALLATGAALDPADTDGLSDIYRYDLDADAFAWLSRGYEENGAYEALISHPGISLLTWLPPKKFNALSENGLRAFFTTPERLVAEDTNEVDDAYEWKDGELGLISAGSGAAGSEFVRSSPDGRTAFFKTAASLLAADRDGGDHDIYAARIGGGFSEPAIPPACGGSACESSTAGRLVRPVPASLTQKVNRKRGKLRMASLGARAGHQIIATGGVRVDVFVPAPGRVSLQGQTNRGGRQRTVATGVAGATHAGGVSIWMSVARPARQRLQRRGVLSLRLILRQGESSLERFVRLKVGP